MKKNDTKKILIVIDALDVGGAEMDIIRNFSVLNQHQQDMIEILTYHHRGVLADLCESKMVKVHHSESSYLLKLLQKIPIIKQMIPVLFIRHFIKKIRPDIVHVFLLRPYFYTAIAFLLGFRKRPFLIMSRLNLHYHHQKYPLLARVEKKLCHPLCDKIVGNSQAILQNLTDEGVSSHKKCLIYNGIETEKFTINRAIDFYQTDYFTITAIGNLHSYKGYGDLLEAMRLLKQQHSTLKFKLLIAGRDENNNLADYHDFLKNHQFEEIIQFMGHCDNVIALLQQSHLHVHPSHTEGLPNAIIEAMSAELPVIATNVGGIPELIDDGKTGLLIAPHAPQQLADKIAFMLQNPQKMHQFGQAGKAKADKLFNLSQSVLAYQQLYKGIMKKKNH